MGLLVSGLTQSSKFNKSQKKRSSFITYITPSIRELKTMMQDAKGMYSWNTARVKTRDAISSTQTRDKRDLHRTGRGNAAAWSNRSFLPPGIHSGSGRLNPPHSRMATLSPGQRPPGPTKPHSHMQWKQMLMANIIQKHQKKDTNGDKNKNLQGKCLRWPNLKLWAPTWRHRDLTWQMSVNTQVH